MFGTLSITTVEMSRRWEEISSILESLNLDVGEFIEDLRLYWEDREDMMQFNDTALTKVRLTGDNYMFCCPYHYERNPSCGMSKDFPYGWNCFGCGASGNIDQLVAYVVGLPNELYGRQFIMKHYFIESIQERKPINIESLLDGDAKDRKRSLLDEDVEKYKKKRHSYIESRGFSDRTLRKYEIGYDEETKSITFPVRTSKGLIRFIKRRFVERKGFLNEKGVDKKDIIYGLYYIIQAPKPITEIYLTESETDTMACYECKMPAGSILGRILFKEQVDELMRAGIKTVILFFDNDKYGFDATLKAYELISKLTPLEVKVVIYPNGHWGIDSIEDSLKYGDANDLLLGKAMDRIEVVTYLEFIERVKNARLINLK